MKDSATDFLAKGPSYAAAREILQRGCEVPPSLEVFDHELGLHRGTIEPDAIEVGGLTFSTGHSRGDLLAITNPSLKVEGMARRLSDSYHRVNGFFDQDDEG